MHFFLLDCTILHQWLIERSRALADKMVANIARISRKFNKAICVQFDGIVKKITAQSETTEELVKQTKYVEDLRVGELMELRVHTHLLLHVHVSVPANCN